MTTRAMRRWATSLRSTEEVRGKGAVPSLVRAA